LEKATLCKLLKHIQTSFSGKVFAIQCINLALV